MQITNNTTTTDVAELMGQDATEQHGRILMGLLSRDGFSDTDEVSGEKWAEYLSGVVDAVEVAAQ